MKIEIEIAVSPGTLKSTRGELLERLATHVIEAAQFTVTERVRITGIEVDLLAKNQSTGETVFVECKACRDALPAETITKLLGNIELHDASAGWLITTGPLSKDAKGIIEKWSQKPPDQRRRLRFIKSDMFAELLVKVGSIREPVSLILPKDDQYADVAYLLVTDLGRFWARPTVLSGAGIHDKVYLFDASTGVLVNNPAIITKIAMTDSSLADLNWSTYAGETPTIVSTEVQPVLTVIPGDEWGDYRPSRPQDFVGRESLQNEFFRFVDDVRSGSTSSRLVAVKSPSGWGKSSVIIKIADRAKNVRSRKKCFVYPVDIRAAVSKRYADLSLSSCFSEAAKVGFIPQSETPFVIGSAAEPLASVSIQAALRYLREQRKVMVLFFDQFEEAFTKRDLSGLFDAVRALSSSIDAAQENLIIGFAWKTDGVVPQDHSAYYMWQSLADRRREFELQPFSKKDILAALRLFSIELGIELNPLLKKILIDQCQGYPWLLKKLCIHLYRLVQKGVDQTEAVSQSLDIGKLFEQDRADLTPPEDACLQSIATDSPADFFEVAKAFGDDTIQSIINRRLVIRRGSRLTLYWDIFRDYVLRGQAPAIPVAYVPQTEFNRYYLALRALYEGNSLSIAQFSKIMSLSLKAAENVIRDLVMIGNAVKQGEYVQTVQDSLNLAEAVIISFFKRHVVYQCIVREKGQDFVLQRTEFQSLLQRLFPAADYHKNTWSIYTNRLVSWLRGAGVADVRGDSIFATTGPHVSLSVSTMRTRSCGFIGDAPPERVMDLLRTIDKRRQSRVELVKGGYRNALNVARTLGLAIEEDDGTFTVAKGLRINHTEIARVVQRDANLKAVMLFVANNDHSSGKLVGAYLDSILCRKWSPSSQVRNGNGMLSWARWVSDRMRE